MILLAGELALVAIDSATGRARVGERSLMNATLAGLLVAELVIDGVFTAGKDAGHLRRTAAPAPADPVLAAATRIVEDEGPTVKAVLSAMDRCLNKQLGTGTWDSVLSSLADADVLAPVSGRFIRHYELTRPAVREEILHRLHAAATSDGPLDPRTAALLSMTGPAHLLERVAPDKATRKNARHRIDHCLEGSDLAGVASLVRKVLQEAQNAAAAGAVTAVIASTA
ncbi:MAG: GPP34 family phosphoprotein [Actinomycetota bacterium]|nr:GPP34 family phosphoprotein [Actinomycetota bacterium]